MGFETMCLVLIRERHLRQKWLIMYLPKWGKFMDYDEENNEETLLSLTSLNHNQSSPNI